MEFGEIDVDAIASIDDPDTGTPKDPWQQGIDELQRQLDQGVDFEDWLKRAPKS
jgi:hypothetical protein